MKIGFKRVTQPAIRQIILRQMPLPGALGARWCDRSQCVLSAEEAGNRDAGGPGGAGGLCLHLNRTDRLARRFPVQSPRLQAGPPHAARPHLPTAYVYLTSDLACLTFDVSFET